VVEVGERQEVRGDIFADGGVRAASCFDGDDAFTVAAVSFTRCVKMVGGVAYAGRALFLVRNSQSSRVKMSFVTAAIE
jgi:hypothetical protein